MWDPGNPSKISVCFTASALPTRSVRGDDSLYFKGALPDKYETAFCLHEWTFQEPQQTLPGCVVCGWD